MRTETEAEGRPAWMAVGFWRVGQQWRVFNRGNRRHYELFGSVEPFDDQDRQSK